MKDLRGKLDSTQLNIAVVVSSFNAMVTERLLEGAVDVLKKTGSIEAEITIVRVPGSFEIPLATQRLARTGKFKAIICLGALIRGETPHFDYICQQTSRGISEVALQNNLPVTYGLITADTVEQAMNRAGPTTGKLTTNGKQKYGNKGAEAALAAVEMANLIKELPE